MKKAADRVLSTTRTAYAATSANVTACRRLDSRMPTSASPDTNRLAGSCAAHGSTAMPSPAESGMPACNGGLGG